MTWNKTQWRQLLKIRREKIPNDRQREASVEATRALQHVVGTFIVSFASFGSEINLWPLNEILAKQGRLCLPRVTGSHLEIYRVQHIQDLAPSSWGILEPPNDETFRLPPDQIDSILVPGLGFDPQFHRLGYGKGYYDRLLRGTPQALTIGVGFLEQAVTQTFPTTPHDVSLKQVSLF